MPVKVASEWLNSCSGCEIAILNLGETLLAVLPQLEFVHIPVLMDHKYFGQTGEGDTHHLDIPEAVVGLVSGGIRNQEHLEVAEAMRKSCQVIVALGTCATHGGIPSLINAFENEDLLERYYRGSETTDAHANPDDAVLPPLLDRTYALDEKIKVDILPAGLPAAPGPDRRGHPRPAGGPGAPICPPRASATPAPPSGKAKARSRRCAASSKTPILSRAGP